MSETVQLNGLVFDVRRSARRKTLGLTVDRGAELVAHVPVATSVEDLTRWINNKLVWVYRKLALKASVAPGLTTPEYVSGEGFCYLGRRFRLKVVSKQPLPLQFDGTQFTLRRDARPAESHFRRWYLETGTEWISQRVERLSRHTARKPEKIEVGDLGFLWGSCSKNGIVRFNWRVLQLPVRLIDYVIMHELIHLMEKHHGPKFWQALDRAMPDWLNRKDDLANMAKDHLVFGGIDNTRNITVVAATPSS
jgi:predicted metal-dependent hydrolase